MSGARDTAGEVSGGAADAGIGAGVGGAGSHQSLARGLNILETISLSNDGLTVTEIAAALALDKSTVSRHITTLVNLGYVIRRENRQIVLTSKLVEMAQGLGHNTELKWLVRPYLERLCKSVRELVIFSVRYGTYILYIDQVDPEREVRVASQIGIVAPLHDTAMGRAILFAMPPHRRVEFAQALDGEPEEAPGLTLSLAEIETQRERFLTAGFVTVPRDDDLCRIGAPILDAAAQPIGAIGVYGPAYRMQPRLKEIGAACAHAARGVSNVLSAT